MIRVTRIAGESYDLESGRSLPKALVLSNGVRELQVFVDDEVAVQVLQLMELVEAAPVQAAKPQPKIQPKAKAPAEPVMATIGDEEDNSNVELDGSEPGEEYSDSATGAASL